MIARRAERALRERARRRASTSSRRGWCATRARWPSSSPTTRCARLTWPSDSLRASRDGHPHSRRDRVLTQDSGGRAFQHCDAEDSRAGARRSARPSRRDPSGRYPPASSTKARDKPTFRPDRRLLDCHEVNARRSRRSRRRTDMPLNVSPISHQECSAAEWQARIDLAAAHRLAVMHGFHEGIFNHLTLAVPGRSDRYYQIPFGMHWSEVKASSFMEVGINDGKVKRGAGDVERSAYCIHAPIHKLQPKTAAAVFHTHMPYTSALTRLEDPRIKEIGQTEVGMLDEIAYDDTYTGPAFGRRGRASRRHSRRQGRAVHGQPRRHHGGSHRWRRPTTGSTTSSAPRRCRSMPCGPASASSSCPSRWWRRPCNDIGGVQLLRRPDARRAPLRCAQAHPRPQGAGLRGVIDGAGRRAERVLLHSPLPERARRCPARGVRRPGLSRSRGP